jgi:hypothetical protein
VDKMKKYYFTLISLVYLPIFLTGCTLNMSNRTMKSKYERTVQLSADLSPGSNFTARNNNGSIRIDGTEIANCNLTATIFTRAATKEEAKELSEKIKIRLERFGNKLTAKIDKPFFCSNQVNFNLDAKVPRQTNLDLLTHNGSVAITSISGRVNVTTHNGQVTIDKLSGTAKVETHNGSITCKEISGDTQLITHNGNVKMYCSEEAQSGCEISIVTHNGGIEFAAPPDFSTILDAWADYGSINNDLPISERWSQLKGTIGTGQGNLHLETHNGSIQIK